MTMARGNRPIKTRVTSPSMTGKERTMKTTTHGMAAVFSDAAEYAPVRRKDVLQAAISWAHALEAQAEAEVARAGEAGAEAAFRQAEVELYTALLEWRRQSPQGNA